MITMMSFFPECLGWTGTVDLYAGMSSGEIFKFRFSEDTDVTRQIIGVSAFKINNEGTTFTDESIMIRLNLGQVVYLILSSEVSFNDAWLVSR